MNTTALPAVEKRAVARHQTKTHANANYAHSLSDSQGATRGHRHFPVPCQFAASWLLNFIPPLASAIKDTREGNARDLGSCLRVLRDLEQVVDLEHQGGGYQALHGDGYQGLDQEGGYQVVDQRELWERLVPHISSQGPQRLAQLTVEELFGAIPPAARRTLEALGLPAAAAAELQRIQQPNAAVAVVAAPAPVPAPAPAPLPDPSASVQAPIQTHKICPGCYMQVKLEGGACNSTSCPGCRTQFCYICLRPGCEVVRSHGKCPQGGIDVAAFLAAVQAKSIDGVAAASADIAALANYEPDATEVQRLSYAQHGQLPHLGGDYAQLGEEAAPPPGASPLECLVRALASIGLHGAAAQLRRQQEAATVEAAAGAVGAVFLAASLNIADVDLLVPLADACVAWEAIDASLKAFTSSVDEADANSLVVRQAVQEAMRLEQWLLADECLSRTPRVRGQDVPHLIALRRQQLSRLTGEVRPLLAEITKDKVEGSSSSSSSSVTPQYRLHTLHTELVSVLNELLQMLHNLFGAGAAMNGRCM